MELTNYHNILYIHKYCKLSYWDHIFGVYNLKM